MTTRKAVALTGFLFLSLSPSYVEWQKYPEKRPQIVGYYVIALGLVYWGILDTKA